MASLLCGMSFSPIFIWPAIGHFAPLPLRQFGSKTVCMSATNDDLVKAVELALAGKWDAAHELVQKYEADATAGWIHAVLHKIEGDSGNARYWYRRANRMENVDDEPRVELAAIQAELTEARRDGSSG